MKTYHLNILGSKWKLMIVPRSYDPMLIECDGFTDRSIRTMFVAEKSLGDINDLRDWDEYQKSVRRHEIIHAFFYESGLAQSWEHSSYNHDETTVDWFAIQFPKMLRVFEKAEAL